MDTRSDLREFLTTRRARLTPGQAGLPDFGGRRRVPGLRREEVALIAGMSTEYYVRLERGNATGVSEAVLEGISRASHDVRDHRTGIKAIHHPVVGDLDLSYEAMDLTSDRGLLLLAYTAAPGSPSDDALRVLMSWAATHKQADALATPDQA